MEQFKISKSIEDIIAESQYGYVSIPVKVRGFWSGDTITVTLRRNRSLYTGNSEWSIDIRQASGGRDSKEVEKETDAYRNYGMALISVADFCEELKNHTTEFEAAYQERVKAIQAEMESERQEKQRRIDADPAVGTVQAQKLALSLRNEGGVIETFERGTDVKTKYTVRNFGKCVFYAESQFGETKISFVRMLEGIANSSASRVSHTVTV